MLIYYANIYACVVQLYNLMMLSHFTCIWRHLPNMLIRLNGKKIYAKNKTSTIINYIYICNFHSHSHHVIITTSAQDYTTEKLKQKNNALSTIIIYTAFYCQWYNLPYCVTVSSKIGCTCWGKISWNLANLDLNLDIFHQIESF